MWVDTSVPLWMFWDVYGNTQKLRLVGATQARLEDAEASEASQENDRNTLALTDSVAPRPGLETPAPPPRSPPPLPWAPCRPSPAPSSPSSW